MHKIAVVDDEKNIRSLICRALTGEGFEVREFSNGEAAWQSFKDELPDAVILDIMMPRMSGLELCRRIRAGGGSVPIIFLSSRDDEYDKVLGLETGGDDYVCKPFSMVELTARIKAAVRRSSNAAEESRTVYDITAERLSLSSAEMTACYDRIPLKLSVTEFRILCSLARNPGSVRTREQLMLAAFPEDAFVNERAADSHIKRIRKKIKEIDRDAEVFEAVYGLGYRLRADL